MNAYLASAGVLCSIGVVWHGVGGELGIVTRLDPDKLAPSSDAVPERFELGTLPYELMAGTAAAIDFMADLVPDDGSGPSRRERLVRSMAAVEFHELELRARIEAALAELPGATLYSRAAHRTPTLLVDFDGHDSPAIYRFLAGRGSGLHHPPSAVPALARQQPPPAAHGRQA